MLVVTSRFYGVLLYLMFCSILIYQRYLGMSTHPVSGLSAIKWDTNLSDNPANQHLMLLTIIGVKLFAKENAPQFKNELRSCFDSHPYPCCYVVGKRNDANEGRCKDVSCGTT